MRGLVRLAATAVGVPHFMVRRGGCYATRKPFAPCSVTRVRDSCRKIPITLRIPPGWGSECNRLMALSPLFLRLALSVVGLLLSVIVSRSSFRLCLRFTGRWPSDGLLCDDPLFWLLLFWWSAELVGLLALGFQ